MSPAKYRTHIVYGGNYRPVFKERAVRTIKSAWMKPYFLLLKT